MELNKLLIDGVDYSDYATYSIQGQTTLDESFDIQYIELKGTDKSEPFKPFLDVEMELQVAENKTVTFKTQIDSDVVTEVISNGTYNHNLLFIEDTKWFERLFVEKAIRQPYIHDYTEGANGIFVTWKRGQDGTAPSPIYYSTTNILMTPRTNKNIDFNIRDFVESLVGRRYEDTTYGTLTVTNENGETVYEATESPNAGQTNFTFELESIGTYHFHLVTRQIGALGVAIYYYFDFDLAIITQAAKKDAYTIQDVCNQLLETTITLLDNEQPMFSLAQPSDYLGYSDKHKAQIQAIFDTVSPEFTFNKMSLFEAFKLIGDNCHFIPRLSNRKVYFDLLGQDEYVDTDLGDYVSNTSSLNSNDFCDKLDSQVNNLVNLDSAEEGSITTPYKGGYRTLRTESGKVVITDQNIIMPTEKSIENIVSLKLGYLSDGTYIGDVTPYVYEDSEYQNLYSQSNVFPYAKMYALRFKRGEKNIDKLSFKRENIVSPALESIAIKNIIFRKTGQNADWWTALTSNIDVFEIQYELTYIPVVDTRVTQSKASLEDIGEKPLSIAYNQSASKISSNSFGENLKGTIAKIGNVEKTKMFILPSFDLVPRCGLKYDKDYYISVVKYEIYPNFVKCELGLSKNYNNKNAYVEINSELVLFEYARSVLDRYVIYDEYCEIGEDTDSDENCLINAKGVTEFAKSFNYDEVGEPISIVESVGLTKTNEQIENTEVFGLPVTSLGIGNSLLLAYNYEDSISAGTSASYNGQTREQKYEKYTDIYGEVPKLVMLFGRPTENYIPTDYATAVNFGNNTPVIPEFQNKVSVLIGNGNPIKLEKGVGEIPHITYQLHFVSNKKDLIIGSGLARKNTLITSEKLKYKLCLLSESINKFDNKINLTNVVEFTTIIKTVYGFEYKFKINDFTANQNAKAWAIIQTYENEQGEIIDNEFILGENIDINSGDLVKMPTFTFKRKIKGDLR